MFEQLRVTEEEFQKRIAICGACELVRILPAIGEQCSVCNCVMRLKARFKYFECPKQKWLAVDL